MVLCAVEFFIKYHEPHAVYGFGHGLPSRRAVAQKSLDSTVLYAIGILYFLLKMKSAVVQDLFQYLSNRMKNDKFGFKDI